MMSLDVEASAVQVEATSPSGAGGSVLVKQQHVTEEGDSPLLESTADSSGIEADGALHTTGSDTATTASYHSGGPRAKQVPNDVSRPERSARASSGDPLVAMPELPSTEGVKFAGVDDDSICSSEADEADEADDGPAIPDGGWGWMVVASSLLISLIADGISFSFGLLYIEFLEEFKASKSKTALIGSLFIAVPLLSGPVMSALVDRYGCRSMTVLGGLVATLGFVLASVADSIELMFLTFGVIAGLGLGLVYVTAVVAIAFWFDKKRTLAVGLGACGTGVGTFLYAPMTQYFLGEYGWRGTILLLAGTLLNLCACGCVMRDPEWWAAPQHGPRKRSAHSETLSARSGGAESVFPGAEELRALMRSGETPEYMLTQLATGIQMADNLQTLTRMNAELKCKTNSAVQLPTFLKQSESVPIEVLEMLCSNKRLCNIVVENYPSLLNFRSSSEQRLSSEACSPGHQAPPVLMQLKLRAKKTDRSGDRKDDSTIKDGALETLLPIDSVESPPAPRRPPLVQQDSAKTAAERREWLRKQFSVNNHYFRDVRLHRNSLMQRHAARVCLRASSCPNIFKNSVVTVEQEQERWGRRAWRVVRSMFDFSMFLELHFLLMSSATTLLFVWFIVPYFYLAEHMTHHGYEEEAAARLISVIGITNTIGMVTLGWAGDQPWMNVTKSYAGCLMLCGVCTAAFPLLTPWYPLLVLNSALFGLFFASTFSFTPGILVELIPLEKFTLAYGLILLCQGIGHLIGPPLSGMIFDVTGHWDLSFYLAGLWIASAGLLVSLIPVTRNVRLVGSAPLEKDLERMSQLSK